MRSPGCILCTQVKFDREVLPGPVAGCLAGCLAARAAWLPGCLPAWLPACLALRLTSPDQAEKAKVDAAPSPPKDHSLARKRGTAKGERTKGYLEVT